jgi:zinc transport system substrate-binding protein
MKKIRALLGMILVFCLIFLASCSPAESSAESSAEKPIVAVSIIPQKTFVEAVCGDLVEVIALVPPGNSPGNYEPTPEQMEEVSNASVYFTIGIPTETANILPDLPDVQAVSLQDAVAAVYPDREFESGGRDPHIWLSPKRVEVMINTIAQTMSEIDQDNKDIYQENAEAYIAQLENADNEISEIFEDVVNKDFIIYHPAYGYFADDYGLTMYALQESGKDATPQHLQDLIDAANEKNIKVVYIQAEFDSSQAEAFAEEIEGKTTQLSPLSANYIEDLINTARTMAENMQ